MTTLLQVLYGLAVLCLPMIMAGLMIMALAASASLLPVMMPVTTIAVLAALGIAWVRHRRARHHER